MLLCFALMFFFVLSSSLAGRSVERSQRQSVVMLCPERRKGVKP